MLNVNGFITDPELLAASPLPRLPRHRPRASARCGASSELHDPFAGHDAFVTIGERIGQPDCAIPTCGLDWITTRPAGRARRVAGERRRRASAFTSVASWRGPFAPIEFEGADLRAARARVPHASPSCRSASAGAVRGRARHRRRRGRATSSCCAPTAGRSPTPLWSPRDPWAYRDYVQGSKAELMVAKNMYVRARSGWFSDRSICYLASGPPGARAGHRLLRAVSDRRGLLAFSDARGGARARRAVAARLRAPLARGARARARSTSTPTASSVGCWKTLG